MTKKSSGATPKTPRKRRKATRKTRRKPKPPPIASELFDAAAPESPATGPEATTLERVSVPPEPHMSVKAGECAHVWAIESVGVREVRALEIMHLIKLRAFSLHLECDGVHFVCTTSRAVYAQAREEKTPAFVGGELLAIAHAAQNDRMFDDHFREVLRRKANNAGWRLTPQQALGVIHDAVPLTWSVGEVFDRIGARLVRVESHV